MAHIILIHPSNLFNWMDSNNPMHIYALYAEQKGAFFFFLDKWL